MPVITELLPRETLALFRCPDCYGALEAAAAGFICSGCRAAYGADLDKKIYRLVSSKHDDLIAGINANWTKHWEKSSGVFNAITSWIRANLSAPLVLGGLRELAAGPRKVFLEAGSGTSETSALVDLSKHTSVSLDISDAVLKRNLNPQIKLQGDLFNLPLADGSVDVIFNIGVHEHYDAKQNAPAFKEFLRVLRPGGRVVLYWPWYWAPLMILGRTINLVMSLVLMRKWELYPNQYWELRRFAEADAQLRAAGFAHVRHYLSAADLFSMMVLDYEKRSL